MQWFLLLNVWSLVSALLTAVGLQAVVGARETGWDAEYYYEFGNDFGHYFGYDLGRGFACTMLA